jgi:FtsH-binding integral membrane protein
MIQTLFTIHAHSWHLVMLFGAIGFLVSLWYFAAKKAPGQLNRIVDIIYLTVIGVQLLLGLIVLTDRIIEGAYFRHHHPLIMIIAVALAHILLGKARRKGGTKAAQLSFFAYFLSMGLILLGYYT